VLVAAAGLLVVAVTDGNGVESDSERIQRLSQSFACPICDGETVADSSTAVSATIREYIADEVAAGSTDREIRDALVRAYRVRILLNPPADGFASLVWVLPVVLVVTAAAGMAAVIGRGPRRLAALSDADRELVERARAERRDRGAAADREPASP
jgi:cytochrome c-type biogenesis protein CcmH